MKKIAAFLALALASLALVACGGDDDDGPTTTTDTGAANGAATNGGGGGGQGGGSTLAIEADPSGGLAFTSDNLEAEAGQVTVEFENPQPVGHDADIEDSSGKVLIDTEIVTESSDTATGNLKPGKYVFFCSVPGHREGGMEGTLTVK
ncbi:MAG TPA: plastocyanin/azurin family copper-binding protein [Solirubrobacterales bacterium]|nr:plastocyanin/azurin family copper-binding protein [Solirubrobacterales bacterium]